MINKTYFGEIEMIHLCKSSSYAIIIDLKLLLQEHTIFTITRFASEKDVEL